MNDSAPDMLAYVKRCEKSWARVLEARNLLFHGNRGISKIIGLLDDAIEMLELNLDIKNPDTEIESDQEG